MGFVVSFGNELRNIRKYKGLKAKDVAELVGVSAMYISEIERDKKIPSDELITKLSKIYGVEEKELFEGFKRVSEDMLDELTNNPNLFDVIFEVSRGKLSEDKKEVLYKQIGEIYRQLLK